MALMHPLIDVDELNENLHKLLLFDIRWSLTDPRHGLATYTAGHIPGAVFVDLDTDLAAEPGPGRHPLPDAEDFASTLGRLGISEESDVVVYDDVDGTVAARLWWMLESIGHQRIRILNGGYQSWLKAGLPTETGENHANPTQYPVKDFTGVVDHDQLKERQVVDVRAVERYRGDHEPVDPKAGHIPGAVNMPVMGNLTDDGLFKAPDILLTQFSDLDSLPVVSCGSGVNACHTALAMVIAGQVLPDVYIGSYSEWSTLDLPVATGGAP